MAVKKSFEEREAELDAVLAQLKSGVQRIQKKAKKRGGTERIPLEALTPPDGVNLKRLKKTRMVFMAMAEESLLDSGDELKKDDVEEALAEKAGKLTKLETFHAAPRVRARPAAAAPPPQPALRPTRYLPPQAPGMRPAAGI